MMAFSFDSLRQDKRAAIAGDRVNATRAEKLTASARNRANSVNRRPIIPCMKAIGMNTAASQSVMAIAAIPISFRPFSAASFGSSPICR